MRRPLRLPLIFCNRGSFARKKNLSLFTPLTYTESLKINHAGLALHLASENASLELVFEKISHKTNGPRRMESGLLQVGLWVT
jgi:hypothetical protein